ncbi:MAG: acyl-CoA dehydratase activase [Candidatus Zixiibacteriota bacterium]
MMFLGIDIGSVALKLALFEDERILRTTYRRFGEEGPFESLYGILTSEYGQLIDQKLFLGLTGIGSKTALSIFGGQAFGEIAAISAGNYFAVPEARTVIEMGGEDSKFLQLDAVNRTCLDFAMNAQCAAGTGSFLDQQANRLKISIEDEFGRLALLSKNPPRIAGRCSVFAKSDMIHLQQIATPDYDIVAGLCFAVARNFKSAIARGKKFIRPIAFEGGVAANPGMVRAFTEILGLAEGELLVPEYYNVIGALGAALLAAENKALVEKFQPEKIRAYLKYREVDHSGREALAFNFPDNKYYDITLAERPKVIDGLEVFLGIDVGSLSTNLVLIDADRRVIARRYLMTEGRPIEAVRRGLAEIGEEVGGKVIVKAVGTTGSGRYLTGDYVGADIVRNEITAQATAAINIDPKVDTVFEIGGQDSKYISICDRAVVDFEMNKVCAAGTGSFLQEQAEKLKINIESEFGEMALSAACPVGCGERCTVFMEADLVGHMRKGARIEDIIAGLAYSIASNYLTKVVEDRRIGEHIFFQGGVAWNKGVVAAFEKLTGKKITVPPHHDVTGAIGAAILAMEKIDEPGFVTSFKGFDLYKKKYEITTFTCEECSNHCEIHKVTLENEEPLYYGSRCERFEVEKKNEQQLYPDYFAIRRKHLTRKYLSFREPKKYRARVGLPRVLHFFEYYPFWRAFFEALDYKVVNSHPSNQNIVEDSLELFSAETCFPIKLVYGHVADLIKKDVDIIFLPSIIKAAEEKEKAEDGGYICPYVQTVGAAIKARFNFDKENIKFICSTISFSYDIDNLKLKFKPMARELGLSERELVTGLKAGLKAYRAYGQNIRKEGEKILTELDENEKAMVIVSRPYNGNDARLSLEIPEKVRNLGYRVIPLDMLPIEDIDFDNADMYWLYGRRILSTAEYVRKHPNLFAIYITSFGCGPDSFITHFFRKLMSGKPYLQLEVDEHSADAGLITRCEAFIDSLRFYRYSPPVSDFNFKSDHFKPFEKIIYIPNMCDHAYPIRAAMERCGLNVKILEEPDELTLEYGKKFTTGKECFPCIVTTGDMIKKIKSPDFDHERSVFFMPGAGGPCRFGQYRQFHRMVLDDLGYSHIPIYSPHSDNGYAEFGLNGTNFRKTAWKGLVFVDGLMKMLHQTRPYEKNKGETEKLYYRYLNLLDRAILKDESLEALAVEAGRDFSRIERDDQPRPLVGVVGEIYLRNNRFSNNYLIEKLEQLGLEVWLATFTEWPLYTSVTFRTDSIVERDLKGFLKSSGQILTQRFYEHHLLKRFSKYFPLRHDYPVEKNLGFAQNYITLDYKGEAVLTIGKAMEMAYEGAAGVVNAMPFNCMPGTVVSSLSRKVAEDLGGIPWLNISYEGLRDSGEETRLEAFADQVLSFVRRSQKINPVSIHRWK